MRKLFLAWIWKAQESVVWSGGSNNSAYSVHLLAWLPSAGTHFKNKIFPIALAKVCLASLCYMPPIGLVALCRRMKLLSLFMEWSQLLWIEEAFFPDEEILDKKKNIYFIIIVDLVLDHHNEVSQIIFLVFQCIQKLGLHYSLLSVQWYYA